jgi:hypothetical protein
MTDRESALSGVFCAMMAVSAMRGVVVGGSVLDAHVAVFSPCSYAAVQEMKSPVPAAVA